MSHALFLAENTKSVFTYVPHPVLKNVRFDFSDGSPVTETFSSTFWTKNVFGKMGDYADALSMERPDVMRRHVLPLLPYRDISLDYDLVLHLRGGEDIFVRSHPNYVQAPLSYFLKILKIERPKKTLLVAQDQLNPVVSALLALGIDGLDYRACDFVTDMNSILNARVLVCGGHSSFVVTLAQCSEKLERVYYPELPAVDGSREMFGGFTADNRSFKMFGRIGARVVPVYLRDYTRQGEWASSPEQKALMLSYPIEKISMYK